MKAIAVHIHVVRKSTKQNVSLAMLNDTFSVIFKHNVRAFSMCKCYNAKSASSIMHIITNAVHCKTFFNEENFLQN